MTERFEGSQRSCREQLARHAERRRELRRARREAEQGRSSPSSEGANAASRRRSAGSPLRYSSAPVPLPLSLLLPGQPATAPLQPGGSNPDGSPPSKRQRSQSDALALLASMSVDQLHASKQLQLPPQQRQQSDTTQSETVKLMLPQPLAQQAAQAQPAAGGQQGTLGAPAQQPLPLPPLLGSTLASTDSANTSGPAAGGTAAAGWGLQDVSLHPLTRAASLPGPSVQSSGGQSADAAALVSMLAAAASRQGGPPAAQPLLPGAAQQADLSLMLQQLVGQSGGSLPPLPQQAGLQSLLLGHPPPGSSQGFGQLSSQVDSALLQLRQQAAQQLLMLEKKQQVLRRTMDMLQHVMQPPAAAPLQLAAQPSGSLDALQLLALLQQPQPQVQPRAAQQQGDALLRMLGFGQPPQ